MVWQTWTDRQKLRLELAALGRQISALKREYELVASVSSRMVGNRIHLASADYWQAVKLFSRDELEATRNIVSAATVEAKFIRQLLDAETAERELGAGVYFEYADKADRKSSIERIEHSLNEIAMELQSLASHCRRKSRHD